MKSTPLHQAMIGPRQLARTAAMLLMSLCSISEAAESWFKADTLSVSGFGTLGVTSKTGAYEWKFLRNAGQRGADSDISINADSRLGLQLNWTPTPQVGFVTQGVLLDRPNGSPSTDVVEWAYLSLRPLPDTQIRLGRINADMFMYSDSRNVGFALPWARPPVDLYGFIPPILLNGGSIEQRWDFKNTTWRAQIAGGQGHASLANVVGSARTQLNARDMLTATLTGTNGNLLFKGTLARTRVFFSTSDYAQIQQGVNALSQLPIPGLAAQLTPINDSLQDNLLATYAALGLQYDRGPWSLQAEASDIRTDHTQVSSRRGYLSLSYRHGPFTGYGMMSRVLPIKAMVSTPDVQTPLAPLIGADNAAQAQYLVASGAYIANSQRTDQQTYTAGLRWDMRPNMALKLQLDRIHTFPQGSGAWVDGDGRNAHATVASVVVDFVWGQ